LTNTKEDTQHLTILNLTRNSWHEVRARGSKSTYAKQQAPQ